MAGISGAALASINQRADAYLRGSSFLSLTPVAGGVAVPFMHDEEARVSEPTEAGLLNEDRLVIFVDATLGKGTTHTYDSRTWTVESVEPDVGGGATYRHRVILVDHAR